MLVVVFKKDLSRDFKYLRKQCAQLPSKMRFISAQFSALLSDDLWQRNAAHANRMARLLKRRLRKIRPRIKINQAVQANAVFATIPGKYVAQLHQKYFFYVWDEETSEVRFMTSFDTTKEDVDDFAELVAKTVGRKKQSS